MLQLLFGWLKYNHFPHFLFYALFYAELYEEIKRLATEAVNFSLPGKNLKAGVDKYTKAAYGYFGDNNGGHKVMFKLHKLVSVCIRS